MPGRNMKKQSKLGEKGANGCEDECTGDMAASASQEAGATGPADPHGMEMEDAFGELGPAPSTTALAKYLKGAMATFQSVLDKAVKSVIDSVHKVEKALEFEGQRIDDLEKKNRDLEDRLKRMESAFAKIHQKLDLQESEVNKAERFSRRNNCRLVGIPEPTGENEQENCIKTVEDLLKVKFKTEVKVERAHRDGKKGDRPRHIIFKTLSYREKVDIIKESRRALQNEKYYMTDDLTKRDLEVKRKHTKEVQELYKKGTKLRFYSGQWRGNGGVPHF